MSISSNMDANFKQFWRQKVLARAEIQSHLKQAAYRLPFDQEQNHLFGSGLSGIYALNDA